jgi:hypothetical protein
MNRAYVFALVSMTILAAAIPAAAQPVISARSGVIAYGEGAVYLGSQAWEPSSSQFDAIKENTVVRTEGGRVEVLLVPGSFLRLGENSSFRLITNRLIDTRLELLSGSAVLEVDQVSKDDNVTVVSGQAVIQFPKAGLYRLDSAPADVKVFKGAAAVQMGDQNIEVPSGKMLGMAGQTAAVQKFDTEDTDSLDNWSHRRGDLVASANVSAANYARTTSTSLLGNSWAWNPYFGMYTYLPMSGQWFSPYGGWFWSPFSVPYAYYAPPVIVTRAGGVGALGLSPTGIPRSSSLTSSLRSSATGTESPAASSSSSARSGGAVSSGAAMGHAAGGGMHR